MTIFSMIFLSKQIEYEGNIIIEHTDNQGLCNYFDNNSLKIYIALLKYYDKRNHI